jgi:tetratricopeptide (TPR) repeat protein
MVAEWYYAKGKQRHGPVTDAQLRELVASGQLLPTDLVWKAGMKSWAAAASATTLFSEPPPLPDAEPKQTETPGSSQGAVQELLNAAEAYARKSQFDQAHAAATDAIRLDPNCSRAFAIRADVYRCQGKAEDAIKDANQAITLDPRNAHARRIRGIAHSMTGETAKAIEDCTEAIQIDPTMWQAHSNRGIVYFKKGEFDRAIADFTEALRLNPGHAKIFNMRGSCFRCKGDLAKAIADFTQAVTHDPSLSEGFLNRGTAHRIQNHFDEAIQDLTEAIRLNPRSDGAFSERGLAYHRKGDYHRAIADSTDAIRLAPKRAQYYFQRAEAQWELFPYSEEDSDLGSAYLRDLEDAIKCDPNYVAAYMTRADNRWEIMVGDDDAIKKFGPQYVSDYTNVIRLRPDWWEGYYGRAIYHLYCGGDPQNAVDDLNRGLSASVQGEFDEFKSSIHVLLERRAEAYESLGDLQKAIADWTTLMQKEPKCAEECQKNIERVKAKEHQQQEKARLAAESRRQAEERQQQAAAQAYMEDDVDDEDDHEEEACSSDDDPPDPYGPQVEARLERMRSLARQYQSLLSSGRLTMAFPRDYDIAKLQYNGVSLQLNQIEQEFFRLRMECEQMGVVFDAGPDEVFGPSR